MVGARIQRGKHRSLTLLGGLLICGGLLDCGGVPAVHHPARDPWDINVVRVSENLDVIAREPMVARQPDGTLFVAGYGEPTPTLWRSRNGGVTWSRVDMGSAAAGAIGNSDVDLHAAPDGTLYIATLVFDRSAPAGTHISVGASTDGGATWKWTLISDAPYVDRPWLATAPDGIAYVTWNDREGVHLAATHNRGLTWTERSRASANGGSSHFAIGPEGELAIRITPFSFFAALRIAGGSFIDASDLIAVSNDGGATWRTHDMPGRREWTRETALAVPAYGRATADTPPRWVEPNRVGCSRRALLPVDESNGAVGGAFDRSRRDLRAGE